MAAPQVSALAALLWSHNPTLTSEEVRACINETAGIPAGWGSVARPQDFIGSGRINAYEALRCAGRPLNNRFEAGSELWWQQDVHQEGYTPAIRWGFGDPTGTYMCHTTPCPEIEPLQGCKSFFCDISTDTDLGAPASSVSATYLSDSVSVSPGACYGICLRGRLYAYRGYYNLARAGFRVGAVFLDSDRSEVSRDTVMVEESLAIASGGEVREYDSEALFFVPDGAQYVRIYAHVEAFHEQEWPGPLDWAQAGAMLDNFQLVTSAQLASVEPEHWPGRDSSPLEVRCRPNPFRDGVDISFRVPRSGSVEVLIFDVQGRQIRRYGPDEATLPGDRNVFWDGKDSEGRRLASGVYFFRVVAGGVSDAGKVVMTR